MANTFLQQVDNYVTLGLEQAGDTIVPEIQLYKRFKPFVEDVLPSLITQETPAYVAHPYAEQRMPINISHACSVVVDRTGRGIYSLRSRFAHKKRLPSYELRQPYFKNRNVYFLYFRSFV